MHVALYLYQHIFAGFYSSLLSAYTNPSVAGKGIARSLKLKKNLGESPVRG